MDQGLTPATRDRRLACQDDHLGPAYATRSSYASDSVIRPHAPVSLSRFRTPPRRTRVQEVWQPSTVPVMTSDAFVPVGFDPPTSLATDQFRLEPLGPQHNLADHAAWMSSIEHIRSTPGYSDGTWPPRNGMTLEENLTDLRRHADDFARGAGFTFTVLDPGDNDVIGCVYLYPSASDEWDVTAQSWVRADRSGLDVPLADAVARWLSSDWPWERVDRCGR
jgi:hypothetical protein